MANLATFKTLLAQEAQQSGGLPNVVLKQATDLGQAFARIVTLDNRKEGETNEQVTGRYVDEFCSAMASDTNAEAVQLFEATTAAFADKIKIAWNNLEGIKEQAKELAEGMVKVSRDYLARDQFVTSNSKFLQLSEDFPVFGWNGTKIVGGKNYLAEAINALVTADANNVSKDLDKQKLDVILSGLDKYVQISSVELSEDARKALVDQLNTACPDIPADSVVEVVDYVTGIREFSEIKRLITAVNTNPATDIFKNIMKFDEFVCRVYPICDAIVSDQVKIDDASAEAIKNNAKSLVCFCKIVAYYELMERETVFRESLLLQGGYVNGDLKETFAQQGGTNLMIANYLRSLYTDDRSKVPAMGIKGDSIIKADGNVAPKVQEDISRLASRIDLAKTNARYNAFLQVAIDYVSKKVDRECGTLDAPIRSTKINELMDKVVSKIAYSVKQYNICLVEASISMIIGLDFADTFVEELHDKLGAAYLAMVNSNSEVDGACIDSAEVGVIAELVCDFIADKMIDVVPCQERSPIPVETPQATQTPEEVKETPGAAPAQES